MTDVHSPEIRSKNMRAVRSTDTRIEITVRKALHALGFRYRLHVAGLPGKPDIVLPRYRAVIFVHGCFWHMHGCRLFKWPQGNAELWREKLESNRERDRKAVNLLKTSDWRVLICWECAFRGPGQLGVETAVRQITAWLNSDDPFTEIKAQDTKQL